MQDLTGAARRGLRRRSTVHPSLGSGNGGQRDRWAALPLAGAFIAAILALAAARPAPLAAVASCRPGELSYLVARFDYGIADARSSIVRFIDRTNRQTYRSKEDWERLVETPAIAGMGAVYGLAYDRRAGIAYAAAYQKYWAAFGPGGPGAIYRVDLGTASSSVWARLDAGDAHHSEPLTADGDRVAVPWVGKAGLGGITLDDSFAELFVANLHDRRIYRLSVPDGQVIGSLAHGAAAEPWAPNARLLGLGYRDGWLYHGVVDSREDSDLPGSLSAHIYRSRNDGGDMQRVLSFALDYARASPWGPWSAADSRSEPMIGDIEFRPTGEMIIGLRDRQSDQQGEISDVNGDLIAVRAAGPGWVALTQPPFYPLDVVFPPHQKSSWGTLATEPGQDRVVATATWGAMRVPTWFYGDGAIWFNNTTGRIEGPADGNEPLLYGETLGLGDIEAICPPDPNIATATASPSPSPTATGTPSATPTATASRTATAARPSPTPTPSAGATVTPLPTTTPAPIYLPLILGEACVGAAREVDVVLVLDASTSMLGPTLAGRSKLASAQAAAWAFAGLLNLGGGPVVPTRDRVAVVGFNEEAWLEVGLTQDPSRISAALDRLPARMQEGTRLDRALERGMEAARPSLGAPGRTAVLVLLTDGLPNRVPTPAPAGSQEDTVLEIATRAKSLGVRIYTIGLGRPDAPEPRDRINDRLLRALADRPDQYFETPNAEELTQIYAEIARAIGCDAG